MRLNNRNRVGFYTFLGTVITMLVLFGVLIFLLEIFQYDFLEESAYFLLIIPLVFASLFYLRGRQLFEYDSDGEALNFKNRNVILFLNKPLSDEFPKYKLLSFEVVNLVILKKLYLTISSKKKDKLILRYDVSYLTHKELNDLKLSLSKVVRNNRELKAENLS